MEKSRPEASKHSGLYQINEQTCLKLQGLTVKPNTDLDTSKPGVLVSTHAYYTDGSLPSESSSIEGLCDGCETTHGG